MAPPLQRLGRLLNGSESYRFGFAISSFVNLVAKTLGFFTTILTAFLFGSTAETDLFFFVIASTGIISSFLINLDGTVFIPRSMKLRTEGRNEASNDLLRSVFATYLAISALMAIVIIFNPLQWMGIASRFPVDSLAPHADLIRLTGPWLVITTLNFFLVDVITSFKRFSLPMISGLTGNLVNVLFILAAHQTLGIKSVIAGSLLGGVCQFCILLYNAQRLTGCRLLPLRFPFDSAMLRYMGFSQGAYICSLFGSFIPMYLLSGYPQGIISSLGYGQRIIDLISLLLIAQFSNVLAIKLNELHIGKETGRLSASFESIGRSALFFTLPVIVAVSVLSFESIQVLFVRGEFLIPEALVAARFTRVLIWMTPLLLINTMIARLVMATGNVDKSFGFQAFAGVMSGGLCAAGIHFFGPHGYPYAMIIAYMLSTLVANLLLGKWIPGFSGLSALLRFGSISILVNGAIIPLDLLVKSALAWMPPVAIIAIAGCAHMVSYGIICYVLKMYPPLNQRIDMLTGKKRP